MELWSLQGFRLAVEHRGVYTILWSDHIWGAVAKSIALLIVSCIPLCIVKLWRMQPRLQLIANFVYLRVHVHILVHVLTYTCTYSNKPTRLSCTLGPYIPYRKSAFSYVSPQFEKLLEALQNVYYKLARRCYFGSQKRPEGSQKLFWETS